MYSKIMAPENEYNLLNKNLLLDEYIAKVARKEKVALAQVYNLTKTSVYGFSLSILKNASDAEDILQDTYIKIYENASNYKSQGKPLAWILTIAKNLAYMKMRNRKNVVDIDEIGETLVKKETNIDEDKMVLQTAFKILSDEERTILILHANEGFKHKEISKLLEIPLSTVLSKYHRAIKKMKSSIGEEDKNEEKRN